MYLEQDPGTEDEPAGLLKEVIGCIVEGELDLSVLDDWLEENPSQYDARFEELIQTIQELRVNEYDRNRRSTLANLQRHLVPEITDTPEPVINYSSDDWVSFAACRGQTRLFYPPLEFNSKGKAVKEMNGARRRREAAAKAICDVCVVQESCLEYALSKRIKDGGIYGGQTQSERNVVIAIRKKQLAN